jgi:uncharacterized protein (DUF2252 family)
MPTKIAERTAGARTAGPGHIPPNVPNPAAPARPRRRRPVPATPPAPAERAALGRALRGQVPRDAHAEFRPAPDRPDPVRLLEAQERSRVPDLVAVRHERMLASPFSYFRGAALPMAADLALTPRTGLHVQACGDAHLANFGIFATGERGLVFDVNDFGETLPGPWEWDVKRLAASLEVAARVSGFSRKERTAVVAAAAGRYRETMREFAGLGNLAVWYAAIDAERFRRRFHGQLTGRQSRAVAKAMVKARGGDSMQALGKLACRQDGKLRIVASPPLVVPLAGLVPQDAERDAVAAELRAVLGRYRRSLAPDRRALLEQYHFADMARKVAGVGSVGTRCWIVLMLGRDPSDPLFLQVKEAEPSVFSPFAGVSAYDNQGQRVVAGQRLMQAASDIFLGWDRVTGIDGVRRDFYVRQLRDWKFSADIATMVPAGLRMYGQMCAWTLARAHARSGDRVAIAAYLGGSSVFDRAIATFAAAYADQNERDYDALVSAAAAGRVSLAAA